MELGDTVVKFLSVENPSPKSQGPWQVGYSAPALEVENMESAVAYLKTRGIEVTWGPADLGDSKRAEIRDPDGLTVEVRAWK